MKFIARTVLAFALTLSAAAQAVQGTIGVATTDAVSISTPTGSYVGVHWQVLTAGTATVTTEFTSDGVNWKMAPFSTRTDQVSANPAAAAWQNTAPVVGAFDTILPGNARAFRVRCGTVGTSTVVAVTLGDVHLGTGTPIVTTLFDTTSAVNTAIDTGIIDTSGWGGIAVTFVTPAGGSGAMNGVDDAGTNVAVVTVPASATVVGVFSPNGVTTSALGTAGSTSVSWLPKRSRATTIGVAALTSRIRIEAWR